MEEVYAMLIIRPWLRPNDTAQVQRLASRLWPRASHPGGLGWEATSDQLPDETVIALRDGRVVGWAGLDDGFITVQSDQTDDECASSLLSWAIDTAGRGALSVGVFDGDELLLRAVINEGFTPDPGSEMLGMFHAADHVVASLPTGYRIRSTQAKEKVERVTVHRDAWRPATLAWPDDDELVKNIPLDATSRFTSEQFDEVQKAWLYDERLDLVVEAPDGTLAACCTVWWDPAIGVAEVEPLGVVPAHRRLGLAGALVTEARNQIALRGGKTVFINTWITESYPAPAQTYLTVGFQIKRRGQIYKRA